MCVCVCVCVWTPKHVHMQSVELIVTTTQYNSSAQLQSAESMTVSVFYQSLWLQLSEHIVCFINWIITRKMLQ